MLKSYTRTSGSLKQRVITGLLLIASSLCISAVEPRVPTSAEAYARAPHPVLRVPYMSQPPTIDGRMHPAEWDGAAAYTGLWQDYGHDQFLNLAYHEKQATFWIGYDDEFLYVAHRSPVFPRGSWLTSRGKYRDVLSHPRFGVLWDDHIEFQIRPTGSDEPSGPFFKWSSNPIDTPVDFLAGGYATAPIDTDWRSHYDIAGNWPDEEEWVTEMRIPLESMRYGPFEDLELPIADGTVWRAWLARAIGGTGGFTRLFSAATPGGWLSNSMRLVFDSSSVSARVTDMGPLMRDGVALQIGLTNHGEHSEVIRVGFYIENDEELILMNEEEAFIDLLAGESTSIRLEREGIGISEDGNAVWVDIRTLSGDIVYRSIVSTFHDVKQGNYEEVFVDGMRFSRAQRSPFFSNFAYYPSKRQIYVEVDTDIYGADAEAQQAVETRAILMTADGDEVAEITFPLQRPVEHEDARDFGGRSGHGTITFDTLAEGDYKMLILLFDEDQRIVGDVESDTFRHMTFEWIENPTEGMEDTLWHPYTAIEWSAGEQTLDTLKHQFELGAAGLPSQIVIKPGDFDYGSQLVRPIRLEATADGDRFEYKAEDALREIFPGVSERRFEATGQIGPVRTRSEVRFEADGFMTYDLWYQAEAGDELETLELVIDFDGPMDLFAYRDRGAAFNQDLRSDVFERDGPIVWNSRDDARTPFELFYGNFLPYLFLGNGDRAFIFLAETDQGMRLLEDAVYAQLEKDEEGRYSLRIFFVNEPGAVVDERHIRFGLMTLPTKPKESDFRSVQWDYETIGNTTELSDTTNAYHFHFEHDEDYAHFEPRPYTSRIYTTSDVTSWHLPELRNFTYAGEFLGSTASRPNPDALGSRADAVHPITKRPMNTIFHHSSASWRWSEAQVHSHVHWRARAIRLGDVEGWWWDHTGNLVAPIDTDPVVGNAYDLPEHKQHMGGQRQHAFHFFHPREFFKRLARVIDDHGGTNRNAHYGGVPAALLAPYLRDHVHWEHSAGYSGKTPHMRYYGPDIMRLYANTYTGLTGYIIDNTNYGAHSFEAGVDPIYDRSVIGNALLHDKGVSLERRANDYIWRNVRDALDRFGYFQPAADVTFIPYWRSQAFYRFGLGADLIDEFATEEERGLLDLLDQVKVSIFHNTRNNRLLFIIGNYNDQAITESLEIDPSLLGRNARRIADPEVGQNIPLLRDPRASNRRVQNTSAPIHVPANAFRMIMVE